MLTERELFAFWVIDDDLFRLFPFGELLIRSRRLGVTA